MRMCNKFLFQFEIELMHFSKIKTLVNMKLRSLLAQDKQDDHATTNVQRLFALPSNLDLSRLQPVVFAGGLPRSGTTFLEAILQAHPQIMCMQEFMPLKTGVFAEFMGFLNNITKQERNIWTAPNGDHWRGFSKVEDNQRLLLLLITCLASTTNSAHAAQKNIQDVRVVFCKTPSSEIHFLSLCNAVADIPLKYVHCIREPQAWAKSLWEMPWERGSDREEAMERYGQTMWASAKAFQAISSAGIPVHLLDTSKVWAEDTRSRAIQDLCLFFGIEANTEMRTLAATRVDPWPAERRRQPVSKLESFHMNLLEEQPGTKHWRNVFSMPAPNYSKPD